MEFNGFPSRMQFTPVPNVVFSSLMPVISDISELKLLLHFFAEIYPLKSSFKYLPDKVFLNQPSVVNDFKGIEPEKLKNCLAGLVAKKVLLEVPLADNDSRIYCLNSESNRNTLERIKSGEFTLPGISFSTANASGLKEMPDIFSEYEQNIGILTPLIADELKEAGKIYPETWIRDAIREAVALNKRNWRYIGRILEHWANEGKSDGTYRGHSKKSTDPDKYIRGKYGHMVQR